MTYATEDILRTLRKARAQAGLSQRDLSARIGVPQSHISKIESGATDLRLSSLVELARALDYELVLVPRALLPAVEAIVGNASSAPAGEARQRSAVLSRAQAAVAKLKRDHPDAPEIERLARALHELAHLRPGKADIDALRAVADGLGSLPRGPTALPAIERAARKVGELRSKTIDAVSEAPRAAYALDDEDEDA